MTRLVRIGLPGCFVVGLLAAIGCTGGGQRRGNGGKMCGADVSYAGAGNAAGATVSIGSGHLAMLFGPEINGGPSHAQMTGTYKVVSFGPYQPVTVRMLRSDCTTNNCSSTMTIYVVGSGGVAHQKDLFSPSTGPCGSLAAAASSNGSVTIQVDPASTNGDNNGVEISVP